MIFELTNFQFSTGPRLETNNLDDFEQLIDLVEPPRANINISIDEEVDDNDLLVEQVMSTPPDYSDALSPCFVRMVRIEDLQQPTGKPRKKEIKDVFKLPIQSLEQLYKIEELVKRDINCGNIFVS